MNNDENKKLNSFDTQSEDLSGRREALKKLGKYSAYVAPFTVLALSKKASAATGHGPTPSGRSGAGR